MEFDVDRARIRCRVKRNGAAASETNAKFLFMQDYHNLRVWMHSRELCSAVRDKQDRWDPERWGTAGATPPPLAPPAMGATEAK